MHGSPSSDDGEEIEMRTPRRDLERKKRALHTAILSSMTTRDADHGRDMLKDPYGSASMTHDDEIVVTMTERRARELEEVNRALEEIDAGRYGICRDCEGEIPAARLKVLPFATRCVACQASTEGLRRAA
jgi:RNA polymerase-binding protein DksA